MLEQPVKILVCTLVNGHHNEIPFINTLSRKDGNAFLSALKRNVNKRRIKLRNVIKCN